MLTPVSAPDALHELVSKWLLSYITRPHPALGRRGPVCPYVSQALATNGVSVVAYHFGGDKSLEQMNLAIEQGLTHFQQLAEEKDDPDLLALIMVFPDLDQDHWRLIDDGHRACKTKVVQRGLMLGQFHPLCDAPAVRNADFPVNRAPVPLMVIRNMASHDILFLREDPVWLHHYQATMARREISVERPLRRFDRAGDKSERGTAAVPEEKRRDGSEPDQIPAVPPYVRYALTAELQEMQLPESDSPLELSFILITQVKELLFRMLYVELDAARSDLRDGDLAGACRALARAHRVQHVLLVSWETLTGMSATEFVDFRHVLGEASGRQSFMYRALEFIMGNKEESALDYLRGYGPLHRILDHEVDAPSLYDEVVEHLHRNVRQISTVQSGGAVSREHTVSEEIEAAWLDVYRERSKHPDEYLLAEALIELSFRFSQWRATHLLVVERMIGAKAGTGGTEGADWLRRISEHRFFPELWDVRSKL